MDLDTQQFFIGCGLILLALIFALGSHRVVGVKLGRFWFVVSIPLVVAGLHFIKPSLLPDAVNQLFPGR